MPKKKTFLSIKNLCKVRISKIFEMRAFHFMPEDLQDIQEVLLLLISWFCCCSPGSLLSYLTVYWLSLVLAELT